MITLTHYAHATRLDREPCPGGWRYTGGRVLCTDNRVRNLYRVAPFARCENPNLLSGTVRVKGKNVVGWAIVNPNAGPGVRFFAHMDKKNGNLLSGQAKSIDGAINRH